MHCLAICETMHILQSTDNLSDNFENQLYLLRIFHELPYLSVVFGRIDILREFVIHSLSGNLSSFMNRISSQ